MNTPTTVSTFDIHVSGYWLDTNWIPPRCRKPRTREVPIDTTVSIPSVGLDAAPVAFRITSLGVREIRLWDGRLFEPYAAVSRQTGPTVPGTPRFPAEIGNHARAGVHDSAAWIDRVAEHYGAFVIIDHQVWRETGEPRYPSKHSVSATITVPPVSSLAPTAVALSRISGPTTSALRLRMRYR